MRGTQFVQLTAFVAVAAASPRRQPISASPRRRSARHSFARRATQLHRILLRRKRVRSPLEIREGGSGSRGQARGVPERERPRPRAARRHRWRRHRAITRGLGRAIRRRGKIGSRAGRLVAAMVRFRSVLFEQTLRSPQAARVDRFSPQRDQAVADQQRRGGPARPATPHQWIPRGANATRCLPGSGGFSFDLRILRPRAPRRLPPPGFATSGRPCPLQGRPHPLGNTPDGSRSCDALLRPLALEMLWAILHNKNQHVGHHRL